MSWQGRSQAYPLSETKHTRRGIPGLQVYPLTPPPIIVIRHKNHSLFYLGLLDSTFPQCATCLFPFTHKFPLDQEFVYD